jgi:uncharacterized membrane protein
MVDALEVLKRALGEGSDSPQPPFANCLSRKQTMKNRHSVVIAAPVERVFDFAVNYDNEPQWRDEVRHMLYTSAHPVGVGTQALEPSRILGRELETTTVITDYEKNRRVVSKSVSGPVPIVEARDFEAVPGGTRFTYTLEGDVSGVFLFRLVRPVLAR